MATTSELFDLAVRRHQSGGLPQAEALYRQVIQAEPAHAAAHHMLGLLAHQTGRHDAAIELIRKAVTLNPADAGCRFNLGIALSAQGRFAEAEACFRQVLAMDPAHAGTHYNLGNALKDQGLMTEAAQSYRQALASNPQHANAHNNLGIILKSAGHLAEAAACYRQALRCNPQHMDAHNNLGIALMEQGQLADAALCFRQALAVNPDLTDAHLNLGNAHKAQGNLAEAALCYRRALAINPHHADAHNNLGIVLNEQGQLDEAIACFRQALVANPSHVDAHNGLAATLAALGLLSEALEHYNEALRLQPENAMARWNRALLRLLQGDFLNGWQDYRQGWALPTTPPPSYREPRWDGSPLEGKTILVFAEGGLGDTIQFLRYLPLVQEQGGTVLFECPPALVGICAGIGGIDKLAVRGAPLPPFDVQVPLLSLPAIFGTTLATIPTAVPYLRADPAFVEYWRKELEPVEGFKVGIVWQGNPDNTSDRYRSLPLARFEALARIEGVRLLSLQVGPGTEQLATAGFPVTDLGKRFDRSSLSDLAAVLMNMDLVISVETAPAHLAGALGVPAWILLPLKPDWRWLLERSDSPWYPTMRLFRQTRFGDWSEVFERVALEAIAMVEKRGIIKR
jgi:tetratricopeptide (TPR) repeat protein